MTYNRERIAAKERIKMGLSRQLSIMMVFLLLMSGCSSSKGAVGKISDSFGLGEDSNIIMKSTQLRVEDLNFLSLNLIPGNEEEVSYLQGQFQNNSDHTIRWLNLELLLPGQIPYNLSFYYTIFPGEISPVEQRLVELKETKGDIVLKGISVEYITPDQTAYYFHYDGATQSSKWVDKGEFIRQIPPFEVDDLRLQEVQLIDNRIQNEFYISAYLKNNSIYKLSEITYLYLLPNGVVDTLSAHQRLFPGERSSKVYGKGPESMNQEDIQLLKITYTIDEKEQETHVEYDVKLDCYRVRSQKK